MIGLLILLSIFVSPVFAIDEFSLFQAQQEKQAANSIPSDTLEKAERYEKAAKLFIKSANGVQSMPDLEYETRAIKLTMLQSALCSREAIRILEIHTSVCNDLLRDSATRLNCSPGVINSLPLRCLM